MDELTDARQVSSILSPGITFLLYIFFLCSLVIVYGFLLKIYSSGGGVDKEVTEIIINMSTKLKVALADEWLQKKPTFTHWQHL